MSFFSTLSVTLTVAAAVKKMPAPLRTIAPAFPATAAPLPAITAPLPSATAPLPAASTALGVGFHFISKDYVAMCISSNKYAMWLTLTRPHSRLQDEVVKTPIILQLYVDQKIRCL
jgi:hypothetical protein